MEIRVRVSVLVNGRDAVNGKGSALNETVSKATALVLAVWLIKTGFLLVAALAGTRQTNSRREKIKPFAAQRKRLVLIGDDSDTISESLTLSQ
jgi:hypothetical protein